MPVSPGFEPALLRRHFLKHGADFGVTTEAQYEALASQFLTKPLTRRPQPCGFNPRVACTVYGTVHQNLVRGELIRYDSLTQEFGVLGADGYVSSYYKPQPTITGKSNLKYFHDRCEP